MFSRILRSTVLSAALLLAVGPAAAGATTHPAGPSAVGVPDPNQHAAARSCGRDCLIVTAHGFVSGETIRIRELRRPAWQRIVRADRSGRVVVRVRRVGPVTDVVTFVGLGRGRPASGGTVRVTVPRIAVYRISPR